MKRLLSLCFAGFSSASLAYTNAVDGVEWSFTVLDGRSILYSLVSRVEGSLVIPSSLGGRPLTEISYRAFMGQTGLENVAIPGGVTWIGSEAFAGCSALVSVSIPTNVTFVGNDAFLGCPAELFDTNTIPGVRLLDGWAVGIDPGYAGPVDLTGLRGAAAGIFQGNTNITSVVLPEGTTSLDHDMFLDCSALESLTIPEGVRSFGSGTFGNCSSLRSIRVPDSLKSLVSDAFLGCSSLSSVSVPYKYKDRVSLWNLPEDCEIVVRDMRPFEIATAATLPNVLTDVFYGAIPVEARGGLAPYTWDLGPSSSWGDWPLRTELEWYPYQGQPIFSGTPTEEDIGTHSITVRVTDAEGRYAERTFSVTVERNPDHRPWIEAPTPAGSEVSCTLGDTTVFSVEPCDSDGDVLFLHWRTTAPDGTESSWEGGNSHAFLPTVEGEYEISVSVFDGFFWSRPQKWNVQAHSWREWHVDAATTAKNPDGKSWETAFSTLQAAAAAAKGGDRVLVRPGVYSPVCVSDTGFFDANDLWIPANTPYAVAFRDMELVGVDGPEKTVIDGEQIVPFLRAVDGISGFTLRNAAGAGFWPSGSSVTRCVISRCIVSNCLFRDYFLAGCTLDNCLVVNNRGSSELDVLYPFEQNTSQMFRYCDLHHCTVVENEVETGLGGALGYECEAYNSILWNNRKEGGAIGNYDEREHVTWQWQAETGTEMPVTNVVRLENCCLNGYHEGKAGLVLDDPGFVDPGCGDFRLRTGSPCLDAGATAWARGETDLAGNPRVAGSAPDIGALEGSAPATVFVDATNGSDRNDGLSRATPTRSVRRAVQIAEDGGTIRVAAGVYEPFDTADKVLRILGDSGSAATVVDGGGTNRCAYLGPGIGLGSTLSGFTLRNGRANGSIPEEGGFGGGAHGGTLLDCVVRNNAATRAGGGLARSSARRCMILGNFVEGPDQGDGGGAFLAELRSCLVASNAVLAAGFTARGGGLYGGTAAQCTIVGNRVLGDGLSRGGGIASDRPASGNILYGNTCNGEPSDADHGDGPVSWEPGSLVGIDPRFVDRANGDYRLLEVSPAVDVGATDVAAWLNLATPDTDLDGNPRVRGNGVDLGCYESPWTTIRTRTVTSPDPVPYSWLDEHRPGPDYEAAAASPASNRVNRTWECYVAGLDPNCETNRFFVEIVFSEDGAPDIRWTPDLNQGGTRREREYVVEGKSGLADRSWGPTNEATRFFRVKVEMP